MKNEKLEDDIVIEHRQLEGQMNQEEMGNTKWEELGISNDFLFGKVMRNPELCKELLQRILPDLKIDHIEYPQLQRRWMRIKMLEVSDWMCM